jgi:hypothetical protein
LSAKDPKERHLIALHAISVRWANTPVEERREKLAKAQAAFLTRFEREVDPEGVLPPEERAFRAAHAKRAYFAKLALRSVQARRAKKAAKKGGK